MGEHVFLDDNLYKSICIKGGHALLEKLSYGRLCVGGVHVFEMAYLTMCCVFPEDMSYWRTCFS